MSIFNLSLEFVIVGDVIIWFVIKDDDFFYERCNGWLKIEGIIFKK